MDHGGPIPIGDFGLTPDAAYLNQSPGAHNSGGNPDHIIGGGGPRGNSPSEFMGTGNFTEPQIMQSEGLAWGWIIANHIANYLTASHQMT